MRPRNFIRSLLTTLCAPLYLFDNIKNIFLSFFCCTLTSGDFVGFRLTAAEKNFLFPFRSCAGCVCIWCAILPFYGKINITFFCFTFFSLSLLFCGTRRSTVFSDSFYVSVCAFYTIIMTSPRRKTQRRKHFIPIRTERNDKKRMFESNSFAYSLILYLTEPYASRFSYFARFLSETAHICFFRFSHSFFSFIIDWMGHGVGIA